VGFLCFTLPLLNAKVRVLRNKIGIVFVKHSMIVKIESPEDLRKLVSENDTVFVDFWAEWCGPCKMMNPILSKFSDENQKEVVVAKIDVDAVGELAQAYNVSSIPTIAIFQKSLVPSKRIVGAVPISTLEAALKSL
jgi:thioredoxin 1